MTRRMGFQPLKTMLEPLRLSRPSTGVRRSFIYCHQPAMGLFEGFRDRARVEQGTALSSPPVTAMIASPDELARIFLKIVG